MYSSYPGIKLEPLLLRYEDKIEYLLSYAYVFHTTAKQAFHMNKFLVSKETVVLRRWGRSKQKFGFIKRVDKGEIRSDERRRLETSAFQIFHGGNFTFINSFDKTKFVFHMNVGRFANCQFANVLGRFTSDSRFTNLIYYPYSSLCLRLN